MKRIFVVMLVMVLTFSLVSCGEKRNEGATAVTSDAATYSKTTVPTEIPTESPNDETTPDVTSASPEEDIEFLHTFSQNAAILEDGTLVCKNGNEYTTLTSSIKFIGVDDWVAYAPDNTASVFNEQGILKTFSKVKEITPRFRGDDFIDVSVLYLDGRYVEYRVMYNGEIEEDERYNNVKQIDVYSYGSAKNFAYLTTDGQLYSRPYSKSYDRGYTPSGIEQSLTNVRSFQAIWGKTTALTENGDLYVWNKETISPQLVASDVKNYSSISGRVVKNNNELWQWEELDNDGNGEYIKIFDDAIQFGSNYVLDSNGTLWVLFGQERYITENPPCYIKNGLLVLGFGSLNLHLSLGEDVGTDYKNVFMAPWENPPDDFQRVNSVADLSLYNPKSIESNINGESVNFVWLTAAENVLDFNDDTTVMWVLQKDGTLLTAGSMSSYANENVYSLTFAANSVKDVLTDSRRTLALKNDGTLWEWKCDEDGHYTGVSIKVLDNVKTLKKTD